MGRKAKYGLDNVRINIYRNKKQVVQKKKKKNKKQMSTLIIFAFLMANNTEIFI